MPAVHHVEKRATFEVVNHYQTTMIVLPIVFFTIATITVALRLQVRRMSKNRLTIDDYLCILSLLLGYSMVGLLIFMVYETGQGMPTSYILTKHPEAFPRWMKSIFSLNLIWTASVAAIQISLLFFYLRLFRIVQWTRYACYAMIAVTLAWFFSTLVTWFNSCHPLPKFFDPTIAGKCSVDKHMVCSATGFSHVAIDVLILLIPIPAIWTLKVSMKKRLLIIGVFGLGVFATICSIIRMACMMEFWVGDASLDPIQGAWGPFLFQTLETAVGIFCCCLPMLPPVFKTWREQLRTSSFMSKVFGTSKSSSKGASTNASSQHKAWAAQTIGGGNNKDFIPLQDNMSTSSKSKLKGSVAETYYETDAHH